MLDSARILKSDKTYCENYHVKKTVPKKIQKFDIAMVPVLRIDSCEENAQNVFAEKKIYVYCLTF